LIGANIGDDGFRTIQALRARKREDTRGRVGTWTPAPPPPPPPPPPSIPPARFLVPFAFAFVSTLRAIPRDTLLITMSTCGRSFHALSSLASFVSMAIRNSPTHASATLRSTGQRDAREARQRGRRGEEGGEVRMRRTREGKD